MTTERHDGYSDRESTGLGRRLAVLACAAVVATIGVALVVDGLHGSSFKLFVGMVLVLGASLWSAAASRSSGSE
jgi:hypothetical protein